MRADVHLDDIVNVFACCILTWDAFTVMLPAFVLAAAIAVFVPPPLLLRYFGSGSKKWLAYTVAALSGCVLSVCSCNVVPLFQSIYRRGAGLGPAITFLYAGPAISLVSMVFTIQLIGWRIGIGRAIAVPFLAIIIGLTLAFVFRREETERLAAHVTGTAVMMAGQPARRLAPFLGLLAVMMVLGGFHFPWTALGRWPANLLTLVGAAVLVAAMGAAWLRGEERGQFGLGVLKAIQLTVVVLLGGALVAGVFSGTRSAEVAFVAAAAVGVAYLARAKKDYLADLSLGGWRLEVATVVAVAAVLVIGRGIAASSEDPSLGDTLSRAFGPLWQSLPKMAVMLVLASLVGMMAVKWFDPEDRKEWGLETWKLLRTTVPILLVSILAIGFLAQSVTLPMLQRLGLTSRGGDSITSALTVSAFGAFMYFPVLTEVAFTKAFLKLNDLPPSLALVLLLTGSGLSLPGMILVWRAMGLKKLAVYVVLLVVLAAVTGLVFDRYVGQYICPCQPVPGIAPP